MEEIVPGALYLVSTPIGNLEDITIRAIRILRSVNLIAAEDTRTTGILLKKHDIKNKLISYHSYNQKQQVSKIMSQLKAGSAVALVSDAGTPGISDPAYILVRSCIENNIRMIPVPGACAILASLVVSGLPVNRFVFEGFLQTKKGRKTRIKELAAEKRTIVFYESPHRIIKTVTEILEIWGNRNCVMGREITKKFEEFYRGTLSDLIEYLDSKSPKGEIVLLIEGDSSKRINKNEI